MIHEQYHQAANNINCHTLQEKEPKMAGIIVYNSLKGFFSWIITAETEVKYSFTIHEM